MLSPRRLGSTWRRIVQVADSNPPESFDPLTARESELLKRAGERVFALSRRLADREREVERLNAEVSSLRELLAENRNIREILSAQITSLQTEHEREYEERSELRRLVAGLHLQLQEVLPMLIRKQAPAPGLSTAKGLPAAMEARAKPNKSWTGRLLGSAERELRGLAGGSRKSRR
jgi:hypothetical protein